MPRLQASVSSILGSRFGVAGLAQEAVHCNYGVSSVQAVAEGVKLESRHTDSCRCHFGSARSACRSPTGQPQ